VRTFSLVIWERSSPFLPISQWDPIEDPTPWRPRQERPESVGRGPVWDSHHGKRVVAVSYDLNEEVGGPGVPPRAPGRGWRRGSTQRSGE
jgi:hypothetical protein